MEKFKFAIIGCGRISRKHADAIAENHREADLVAVSDIIPERMNITIEEYLKQRKLAERITLSYKKSISKYVDYKEMLDKEDIDIVTIATESGYHVKHAIDCLNTGKHVIVEKPMALSISDASNMIDIAKKNKVKLAVCFQNRFNPAIQRLRKAIIEGRFGKLVNCTARILWNRDDDYYKQAPWRGTWELDGGILMNQCIHNIDLLQWMIGEEIKSVYAQTGTFLRDIETEDFGAIIIRFKNNVIGIVEGSVCVYPKNLEETLSIFGEQGTVVIGGLAVNKIETWRFADGKDSEEEILNYQEEDTVSVYGFGHTQLFKDMIEAINEDREPLVNGNEGMKAMEIILAAYKSCYSHKEIHFPLNKEVSTLDFKKHKY